MTLRYEYVDVTARPDLVAPYPEVVAVFEGLGWRQLGRVVLELGPAQIENLMRTYAVQDRQVFEAHLPGVATLLVSADGTTVADVSWFWDSPHVRLASLTTDGQLIETVREWDHLPAWPRSLRRARQSMVLAEEIRRSHVPTRGRSIRSVPDPDPTAVGGAARLGHAHREHVGGAQLATITDLSEAMALRRKAFQHDVRVSGRVRLWHVLVLGGSGIASGAALGLLVDTGPGLVAVAVVAVVVWWVLPHLWRRLSYVQWIRPRFR